MSPAPIAGFPYGVELLLPKAPDLGDSRVVAELKAHCPAADVKTADRSIHLFHRDTMVEGSLPAQTFIIPSENAPSIEALEPALRQTWDWEGARPAVARASAQVMITDVLSSSVPYKRRLEVFQRVLFGAVRALRPIAIHWVAAEKLVDPARVEAAMTAADPGERTLLALNVRLFNIESDPGVTVMDTRGLAEMFLPDLQLHSRGFEVNEAARQLYNIALYLFDRGDVIEDGQTVEGLRPEQKWRCQHEASLVGPPRLVLDIDPGPPHAAGTRGAPN